VRSPAHCGREREVICGKDGAGPTGSPRLFSGKKTRRTQRRPAERERRKRKAEPVRSKKGQGKPWGKKKNREGAVSAKGEAAEKTTKTRRFGAVGKKKRTKAKKQGTSGRRKDRGRRHDGEKSQARRKPSGERKCCQRRIQLRRMPLVLQRDAPAQGGKAPRSVAAKGPEQGSRGSTWRNGKKRSKKKLLNLKDQKKRSQQKKKGGDRREDGWESGL